MALPAKFKPSHEFRLGFDLSKPEATGPFFLNSLAPLQGMIDLTRIERPLAQMVLQRLAASPKVKQWTLDQSLTAEVRKTLINHYRHEVSCFDDFLALMHVFFHRMNLKKAAAQRLASRKIAKARLAVAHMHQLDAELMRQYHDEDLRKLRELYDEQTRLIATMQHHILMLDRAASKVRQKAREEFVQYVYQDYQMSQIFADVSVQQLENYSDAYLDLRVEHLNQIEAYQEQIEAEKATPSPSPKLKPNDKIVRLERKIKEREQMLKQVAQKAAEQCELSPKVRAHLADDEVAAKIDKHFEPAANDAAAIAKAKLLAEVRLATAQKTKAAMEQIMQPLLKLAGGFRSLRAAQELSPEPSSTLADLLRPVPKPNR